MNGKVFLYQPFIPHYRVPIWERLNKALDGSLVVIYGQQGEGDSHFIKEKYRFNTCKVKNYGMFRQRIMFQPFWKPFKEYGTPDVVISCQAPRCFSLFLLIRFCKANKIPLILYGHGRSKKRDISKSQHPADFIHRWLIRNCEAFLCYTEQSRNELTQITDPNKLFVANNTLDTDILFPLRKSLETEGKNRVKERLGLIKSSQYLCFIGRFLKSKQIDLVLKVLAILQSKQVSVGGVIIGNGPEHKYLEHLTHELDLKDVHFTGFIPQWERSAPYLYACDVLVNPGAVGLAVNHALSFGLPVITQKSTTNGPFHCPEVSFIVPNMTGFFAKNGDTHDLAEKVSYALRSVKTLRKECIRYAEENLTVDKMVDGQMRAIQFVS